MPQQTGGEIAVAVQDAPRHDNRFFMWAGHYSIRMMLPAIAVIVVFTVTGRPGGDNGVLSWVVSAVWMAWFATVILDTGYHESRLCERCITATPLDPQAAVTRWDRILRFFHQRKRITVLAVAVTLWFFVGAAFTDHKWWSYVLSVLCYALIGVLFTALHMHRKLYPWCPYCKWDGGGEKEVVPDPDPAASVS